MIAFALVALWVPLAARAELIATASSAQSSYSRGSTNTLLFDVTLYSQVFEGADSIEFRVPAGIDISAVRYLGGNLGRPDTPLLALGMGSDDAGWFTSSHPTGCGYFRSASDGDTHQFAVDVDLPSDYTGDLVVAVVVEGSVCCDSQQHESTVDLVFADTASPVKWTFDGTAAPQLPQGWNTAAIGDGTPWITANDSTQSAPNAVYTPLSSTQSESALISPAFAIDQSGAQLQFHQHFAAEQQRDGGVLEISIDGGAFQDIVQAGGVFGEGAYNGVINAGACADVGQNPLLGRAAWTGTQTAFESVTLTMPPAAAGHLARLRWLAGTDCEGQAQGANGWWLDDIVVVPTAPVAAVNPAKISTTLAAGESRTTRIGIDNLGGSDLIVTATTAADADCTTPVDVPWLHVAGASGALAGGSHTDLSLRIDGAALSEGTYSAWVCVATNDVRAAGWATLIDLTIVDGICAVLDRLFASGFDGTVGGTPDSAGVACDALRTFSRRDAFLSEVAEGYAEDTYTGLRETDLFDPVEFGNGVFTYSAFVESNPQVPLLHLFGGAGVLSTKSALDQLVITFTGAPVTALGGDFIAQIFGDHNSQTLASTLVITLDDGTNEKFTSDDANQFRGLVSTQPIRSVTIQAPDEDPELGLPWGVLDNFVVGAAR